MTPRYKRSAVRAFLLSVFGFVVINVIYQLGVTWHQFGVLVRAHPLLVIAAVANQILAYIVIVPAMRMFYRRSHIRLSFPRTFALVSAGLALSRVLPGGEYLTWRLSLRRKRGAVGATTQWYILYLSAILLAMMGLFVVFAVVSVVLYPNAQAGSVIGNFRYVPLMMGAGLAVFIALLNLPVVRRWVVHVALEKISSKALSPLGIIREYGLKRADVGLLAFAAVATWLVEAVTLYLCLAALGLLVPLPLVLFGFGFARIISNIPIVPGGVGQMEASAALFFAAYGYPADVVITATFVYRLITYWPALTIGVVAYIVAGHHHSHNETGALNLGTQPFARQLHRRG